MVWEGSTQCIPVYRCYASLEKEINTPLKSIQTQNSAQNNAQKPVAFLHTNNAMSEKELTTSVPLPEIFEVLG